MKEQKKNPQDLMNEEEIGNMPEKEFPVMKIKMIQVSEIERRHGLKRYKKCLRRI